MNTHWTLLSRFGIAACTLASFAADSQAATSFSNSLTSFTGNSTVPATQAALNTAGFTFFSTAGIDPEFTMDPTVAFDSSGATFGSLFGGDGGRNYVRANDSDYATVDFTAEVTFVASNLAGMDAFFGLGTGDTALFGWPDWSTQFSSVLVLPEIDDMSVAKLTTFKTQNDVNEFAATDVSALSDGTHRLRLAFDSTARMAIFSIDLNYSGGAFAADATAATVDVSTMFAEDGWPSEPSRLYFGGDDSVIFKDFAVVVDGPGQDGDFDDDGDVDGNDFLVWQRGGSPNPLSSGDLSLWRTNYGAGASGVISAVPEPATVVLLFVCVISATSSRQRS